MENQNPFIEAVVAKSAILLRKNIWENHDRVDWDRYKRELTQLLQMAGNPPEREFLFETWYPT